MRRLLSLPALAVAAFLAACSGPAELSEPLSEPGAAPYDPRLIGVWHGFADDGDIAPVMLVISLHENGFLLADAFYFNPGDDRVVMLWNRRTAYGTVIDDETYYSSRAVDALVIDKTIGATPTFAADDAFTPHRKRGYWILRPSINSDGSMTLSYLSIRELEKLGYTGQEIGCGGGCSFTLFDLSPESLAQLIRSAEPDTLFTESFGTYTRSTAESPSLR